MLKLIYILFVASNDILLYHTLNKTDKITNKLKVALWGVFVFITLLHTGLLPPDSKMSWKSYSRLLMTFFVIAMVHFGGMQFIRNNEASNLYEDVSPLIG